MQIKVNIKTNLDFNAVSASQKLALAKSLTFTAEKVQQQLVPHTEEQFVIRKNWLSRGKYSIRKTPATIDNLVSTVWNDAPWLVGQEEGETRVPQRSKELAVPTKQLLQEIGGTVSKGKHLYASGLIPKSLKPKSLLSHAGYRKRQQNSKKRNKNVVSNTKFFFDTRNGTKFLFRTINGENLTPLWLFVKTAPIPARWQFGEKGIEIAEKEFGKIYQRVLASTLNKQSKTTEIKGS